MEYYAKYSFKRNPESPSAYLLESIEGKKLDGVEFECYKTGNNKGKPYMRMSEPRSLNMRRYFAYTFELGPHKTLTSTERLNGNLQTFGDTRQLGLNDLILFQFSPDLESLDLFFCKNMARSISDKKMYFHMWVDGTVLTPEA